jgi:hypothetical protein
MQNNQIKEDRDGFYQDVHGLSSLPFLNLPFAIATLKTTSLTKFLLSVICYTQGEEGCLLSNKEIWLKMGCSPYSKDHDMSIHRCLKRVKDGGHIRIENANSSRRKIFLQYEVIKDKRDLNIPSEFLFLRGFTTSEKFTMSLIFALKNKNPYFLAERTGLTPKAIKLILKSLRNKGVIVDIKPYIKLPEPSIKLPPSIYSSKYKDNPSGLSLLNNPSGLFNKNNPGSIEPGHSLSTQSLTHKENEEMKPLSKVREQLLKKGALNKTSQQTKNEPLYETEIKKIPYNRDSLKRVKLSSSKNQRPDVSPCKEIDEVWNKLEFLTSHKKRNTYTYSQGKKFLKHLRVGTFNEIVDVPRLLNKLKSFPNFKPSSVIPLLSKKWTLVEREEIYQRLNKMRKPTSSFSKYMPGDLPSLIWNDKTGMSWFFYVAVRPEVSEYEVTKEDVGNTFNEIYDFLNAKGGYTVQRPIMWENDEGVAHYYEVFQKLIPKVRGLCPSYENYSDKEIFLQLKDLWIEHEVILWDVMYEFDYFTKISHFETYVNKFIKFIQNKYGDLEISPAWFNHRSKAHIKFVRSLMDEHVDSQCIKPSKWGLSFYYKYHNSRETEYRDYLDD